MSRVPNFKDRRNKNPETVDIWITGEGMPNIF